MAIVVEDGTGKVDAEAYLDALAVRAYWNIHGQPNIVEDATDGDLEVALRTVTTWQDSNWRLLGEATHQAQALEFPREGVPYRREYFDKDTIPPQVLAVAAIGCRAELELNLEGTSLLSVQKEVEGVRTEEFRLDDISEKITYTVGKSSARLFDLMEVLMAPFTRNVREVERG